MVHCLHNGRRHAFRAGALTARASLHRPLFQIRCRKSDCRLTAQSRHSGAQRRTAGCGLIAAFPAIRAERRILPNRSAGRHSNELHRAQYRLTVEVPTLK